MIPPLEINAPLEVTSTPPLFFVVISCARWFVHRMRHIKPHLSLVVTMEEVNILSGDRNP